MKQLHRDFVTVDDGGGNLVFIRASEIVEVWAPQPFQGGCTIVTRHSPEPDSYATSVSEVLAQIEGFLG